MSKQNETPSEAELLAPWYATGKLNAAETAIVEAELARNPEFANMLALIAEERAVTQEVGDAIGLPNMASFEDALAAEPDRKSRNLFQGLLDAFSLSARPMKIALVCFAVLAVLQTGIIATLSQDSPQQYRTATGPDGEVVAEFTLIVAFVESANIGDVTAIIDASDATIIAGPRGGLYTLAFETESAAQSGMELFTSRQDLVKFVGNGS